MNDVDKFVKDINKYAGEGKIVDQVIVAPTGVKLTYPGVKTETIKQGVFTHFELVDGRMILVNPNNTFAIEVTKITK